MSSDKAQYTVYYIVSERCYVNVLYLNVLYLNVLYLNVLYLNVLYLNVLYLNVLCLNLRAYIRLYACEDFGVTQRSHQ